MPLTTDHAKELAELCVRLRKLRKDQTGAEVLSAEFGVEAWSSDFYELVFSIPKRIKILDKIIQDNPHIDPSIKDLASGHLQKINSAFSQEGLSNQWNRAASNFICAEHVNPILFISSEIRRVHPLPLLSDDEQAELLADVDDLLTWLQSTVKITLPKNPEMKDGMQSFDFTAVPCPQT